MTLGGSGVGERRLSLVTHQPVAVSAIAIADNDTLVLTNLDGDDTVSILVGVGRVRVVVVAGSRYRVG